MRVPAGEQAALLLAAGRIGFGVGGWLTPGIGARVLGIDPKAQPAAVFLVRLFAARDLAMGVGQAAAQEGEAKRWLALGAAVDALDGAAALLAVRRRQIPVFNGVAIALTAAAAVVVGVRARQGSPAAGG